MGRYFIHRAPLCWYFLTKFLWIPFTFNFRFTCIIVYLWLHEAWPQFTIQGAYKIKITPKHDNKKRLVSLYNQDQMLTILIIWIHILTFHVCIPGYFEISRSNTMVSPVARTSATTVLNMKYQQVIVFLRNDSNSLCYLRVEIWKKCRYIFQIPKINPSRPGFIRNDKCIHKITGVWMGRFGSDLLIYKMKHSVLSLNRFVLGALNDISDGEWF